MVAGGEVQGRGGVIDERNDPSTPPRLPRGGPVPIRHCPHRLCSVSGQPSTVHPLSPPPVIPRSHLQTVQSSQDRSPHTIIHRTVVRHRKGQSGHRNRGWYKVKDTVPVDKSRQEQVSDGFRERWVGMKW